MSQYLAFIDETGDPNFNEGASKYFILLAIVISSNELEKVELNVSNLKQIHGLSELKSSKIAESTRKKIFNELRSIQPYIFSITVHKETLVGDWFNYKETFYKYIHKRLHSKIYQFYDGIEVTLDRYGSSKYQESLKNYLLKELQLGLFSPTVNIGSAKDNAFIQLSDFYAGTLRKSIKGDLQYSEEYLNQLRNTWKVDEIIDSKNNVFTPQLSESNSSETDVFLKEAKRYIDSHKHETPKKRVLEYLYFTALTEPNKFTYTAELLSYLRSLNIVFGEEQFRNEIIASLRDDGIVIVGTRKGIKLPTRVSDFMEYIEFSVNLAFPVLKRLKKALNYLSIKEPELDLLDRMDDEFKRVIKHVSS
jgi:hypothetical protein